MKPSFCDKKSIRKSTRFSLIKNTKQTSVFQMYPKEDGFCMAWRGTFTN